MNLRVELEGVHENFSHGFAVEFIIVYITVLVYLQNSD